jgi:tetratricopeptide (TPR) repeat protein
MMWLSKTVAASALFAAGAALVAGPAWADPDSAPAAAEKIAEAASIPAKPEHVADRLDKVLDAFVKSVQEDKQLDDAQREKVLGLVAAQRVDADLRATAITDALAATNADFQAALLALAEEDLTKGIAALDKLSKSENKYLAADASFFLARAHMMEERAEAAAPLLAKLAGEQAECSAYAGEAQYLLGAAQAAQLEREKAIASFDKFLKENPDAPERMRVNAMMLVEELKALKEGTLVDVFDRMGFSRRKLQIEDSGNRTRKEQDNIIAMLDVLIKEAEDKEGQGCCSCSGGGQGKGQGRGGKGGMNPGQGARQSTAQTGAASVGQRASRTNNRAGWDVTRDKQRDQVLAGLKGQVPDRYRKLIEEYYKNLQEEESRQ